MKIQEGKLEIQFILYSPQELYAASLRQVGRQRALLFRWMELWTSLTEEPSTRQNGVEKLGCRQSREQVASSEGVLVLGVLRYWACPHGLHVH